MKADMERNRTGLRRGFAGLLSIGLLLTGCGADSAAEPDEASAADLVEEDADVAEEAEPSAAPDEVDLLLSFLPDMVAVQFLLAEDLGYYEQCGIDMAYKSAAEVENPLQLLIGGAVDYAVVDPLSYVSAIDKGLPVQAIAEDTAKTPISWASLVEADIEDPQDLPGTTVGIQPGLDSALFFDHVLSQELDPEQAAEVVQVPVGYDIQPLLSGSVDAITLWPTNANINLLQAEGTEFNLIRASDYGVEVSGNVLVTTTDRIEEDPDEVLRFLTAVSAGQLASLDEANGQLGVEVVTRELGEELPVDVGLAMFAEVGELKRQADWDELGVGWNRDSNYAQLSEFLMQAGEIDAPLPPEDLYTNEFLAEIFPSGADSFAIEQICG